MTLTNVPVGQLRGREHYRPPAGVPLERRGWWGVPLSALAHLALLVLLLLPVWSGAELVRPTGAGGPGPAGGGGGGGGNGGRSATASPASTADHGERLHYVRVQPAPPRSAARVDPPRKAEPIVKPVVRPPKPVPRTPPAEIEPVVEPRPVAVAPDAASIPRLAMGGAGAGDSGSAGGAGPGSGGGTGTGTGTGRGSGRGSGTGGGEGEIYPATPDFLVMPALPVPSKVRGKTIQLVFEIDATGKITAIHFESTGDSGYDRELRERFMEYRFRPAHKTDGTPVASTYVTELTL